PPSRVTHANYEHIEKRMTKAEVESILGGEGILSYPPLLPTAPWVEYRWRSDQGDMIVVVFDSDQKVCECGYWKSLPPKGVVERTWDWFFPSLPWTHQSIVFGRN